MNTRAGLLPAAVCVVALFAATPSAQTPERRDAGAAPRAEDATPARAPDPGTLDAVANEIGLLRKSVQALGGRLREVAERLPAPDSKPGATPDDNQGRITRSLDLLSRTEQRAEVLRKQLLELTEKETQLRSRLALADEEMRPESIDRSLSLVGTTRTAELREVRRRVLENERRGFESLLQQTAQSRQRLEEDVRQADALVARLRTRLLPLIEREIDKITPEEKR